MRRGGGKIQLSNSWRSEEEEATSLVPRKILSLPKSTHPYMLTLDDFETALQLSITSKTFLNLASSSLFFLYYGWSNRNKLVACILDPSG